jgi:hypothetical protein
MIVTDRFVETDAAIDIEAPYANANVYLQALTPSDRANVLWFAQNVQTAQSAIQGVQVGILAVGSQVYPPSRRFKELARTRIDKPMQGRGDLDLRVFFDTPDQSGDVLQARRDSSAELLRAMVSLINRDPSVNRYVRFDEYMFSGSWRKGTLAPLAGYFTNDPSLIIQRGVGTLPLHVSISGPESLGLRAQLEDETLPDRPASVNLSALLD